MRKLLIRRLVGIVGMQPDRSRFRYDPRYVASIPVAMISGTPNRYGLSLASKSGCAWMTGQPEVAPFLVRSGWATTHPELVDECLFSSTEFRPICKFFAYEIAAFDSFTSIEDQVTSALPRLKDSKVIDGADEHLLENPQR